MAVRTIECTECGTTVPYGRLSCPSCGELLASVAGTARRLTSLAALAPDPDPTADADDAGDLGALTWPSHGAAAEPDPAASAPSADVTVEGPEDTLVGSPMSAPAWTSPPFPPQPSITITSPPSAEASVAPGAYIPPAPSAVAASVPASPIADVAGILPAGPPAPARAWAGPASVDAAATGTDLRGDASGRAGTELSLTDPARRAEAIDWIAVAGAALASVGFLLPWARTIIGADGVGYLDTWGFAGPGHVVIVAGLLVVLALAVAKTRVPAWLRLGIPGLALSTLLVGLLWPYLLGPLGPLPGAYLSLVGALILGAAAVAALVTDRHARTDPTV